MTIALFGAALLSTLEGVIGLDFDLISGVESKWIGARNESGQIFDVSQMMTGAISQLFAVLMAAYSSFLTMKTLELENSVFGQQLTKFGNINN